jgi:hypothetical protein
MTGARLAGRAAGGSTGPAGFGSFRGRKGGLPLVRGLGQGGDLVPGGCDRRCPGPSGGDLEPPAATAARQPAGGVPDAVAQGLGLGLGERAVEGEQSQSGPRELAPVILSPSGLGMVRTPACPSGTLRRYGVREPV